MMDTGPLENPESPASTTTTDSDASYSDLSSVASPTGSGSMDVDTPITTISSPGSGSQAGEEEEVEEVGRNLIGELLARTLPPLDDPLGANRLLDGLLSRWHQWRQSPTGQTSQQAGNQSEASSSIGNTAGGYSVSQNPPPSGQRGGEGGASKEAEAEDEPVPEIDAETPRRRQRPVQVLFACPYWKKDCQVWRDCFGYKLTGVKYVKDHLKRVHAKICYCDRCGAEFESKSGLETHRRSSQSPQCNPRSFESWWLSEAQKRTLSKRPNPKHSPEEQWYAVWDVIFPSDRKPDSPFIDQAISEDLSSFLEFARVQGPDIVRDMGMDAFPGALDPRVLQVGIRRLYSRWASGRDRGQGPVSPLVDQQQQQQQRSENNLAMVVDAVATDTNTPPRDPNGAVLDDASTNFYTEEYRVWQHVGSLGSQPGELTQEDLAFFD